jgi:hypothetical protein
MRAGQYRKYALECLRLARSRTTPQARAHLIDMLGEWDQVVVMHPHEVIRPHERRERARERVIDSPVADVIRAREIRQPYSVMHRWPKCPICEPAIVLLTISWGQVDDGILHPPPVDYCRP